MNSYREHSQDMSNVTRNLGRAALRAFVSATLLPFMTSCGATEPATPGRDFVPNTADPRATPALEGDGSGHGDINVEWVPGPELASATPEQVEQAMREVKRLWRAELARPDLGKGGCEPAPALIPVGSCQELGTCDTPPFLADSASANIGVSMVAIGPEVPPGSQLMVEVIKCGGTASTVMTRSADIPEVALKAGVLNFSVPTEPKEKYFLRISNKEPAVQVVATYQVNPGGP
jgi:hypothetical protein